MNYRMMMRVTAQILSIEAAFMLPALFICLLDVDKKASFAFFITIVIILVISLVFLTLSKGAKKGFYAREGLVCVGLGWALMSALGALPFTFSGEIPNYIDALFETVSGFTTTGSSILSDVEVLSRGILYWRSFTHWIGGMGALVLLLAVLPKNSGFAMHLLRAESPGPSVDKLVPKMKNSAMILYLIYIALTFINILFLVAGKMPLFDAVCTALGTAGTGGFGIKNSSMAGYSPYLQNVTSVFMLLFGINFSCFYLILLKQFKSVFRNDELKFYIGLIAVSTALITINIRSLYTTFEETLRHAFFQVSSIVTTTGFATADFDLWPSFSKAIILCLMLTGACAGSTGGGFKCIRVLLIGKSVTRNIRKLLSPKRVQVVRINKHSISDDIISSTNTYLSAYLLIMVISFLLISLDGFSVTTNLSAVISCLNNIGPGFEAVGPTCNFSGFSVLSKLVLILNMLLGRLEIFPILVLFSVSTWKHQ